MSFTSYTFALFFGVVFCVHVSRLPWRTKKLNLIVASYVFYAAWQAQYLLLIAASTLIDWFVARALGAEERPRRRKLLLGVSLITNLGLLAVFKYADFFVTSVFGESLALLGFDWTPPRFSLVLPVGISFYTFQTISYSIDVYRKSLAPAKSFVDYALYVAFFPQLVAGPIVRAGEFLPQLRRFPRHTREDVGYGLILIIVGLWQKTVLADAIMAPATENAFAFPGYSVAVSWVAAISFSGQVLFDFAGYSTCAIGVARCLGFRLPTNFRYPYASVGFTDFWRRWHITLSTWLRDYLYVSFTGDTRVRVYSALMLTMILGGLWHGSTWNFVFWGALHGAFLVLERIVRESPIPRLIRPARLRVFLAWVITLVLVLIAWVFFRAPDFESAWLIVKGMFGASKLGTAPFDEPLSRSTWIGYLAVGTFALNLIVSWFSRDTNLELRLGKLPPYLLVIMIALMLFSMVTFSGTERAFLYFQF